MKPCCAHSSPVSTFIAIAPHVAAPCGDSGSTCSCRLLRGQPSTEPSRSHASSRSRTCARARSARATSCGRGRARHGDLRADGDLGIDAVVRMAVRPAAANTILRRVPDVSIANTFARSATNIMMARADRTRGDDIARGDRVVLVQRPTHHRRPHHAERRVVENRLLIAIPTCAAFIPAMPRQPVTVSNVAAGPAGTRDAQHHHVRDRRRVHVPVCARIRPVGDSDHRTLQPSPPRP